MLTALILSVAHAACPTFAEPVDDWVDASSDAASAAGAALDALEAYAFPSPVDEANRTGVRTDGLVIVRDGEVLYERYGRDWTADKPHLQWSSTKSVAATLVGMAVLDGTLDVDASICDTIEVDSPTSCEITTRNLMEHGSGLAWRETYEGQSPTASSIVGMLYGAGKEDMAGFVSGHPLRDVPGTTYSYSSGDTMVQAAVAHALLTKTSGADYLTTRLFGPLGMKSAEFEVDGKGVPIGSSSLYITPRDMARYGAFLLQDGCWGGERLLPEGWMARATTPASTVDGKHIKPLKGALPGWNVWLNHTHPAVHDGKLPWPDAPEGTFAALGHWRQAIYVLPEHGVVVARTGDDRDGTYQHNLFLGLVTAFVEAVPSAKPVEAPVMEAPEAGAEPKTEITGSDTAAAATEPSSAEVADESAAVVEAPVAVVSPRGFTPAAFPPPPLKALAPTGSTPPDKYDVGLLSIATSFAAMHGCACRHTSGRSEEACTAYIRIEPDVAKARFDDDTRTVTAKAFGFAKTRAQPGPEGTGCRLVD